MRSLVLTPASTLRTSITPFGASNARPPNGSVSDFNVDDSVLTHAERALFGALNSRGIRFLIVGLGAAVLEGAPIATQDLDIWLERVDDPRLADAARAAGGFWVTGFGVQPPAFGGEGFERLDVVLTAHGLASFDEEYANSVGREIDGVSLRVLPLARVIASKRATSRPKDLAALPALEATLAALQSAQDREDSGE